jgi:hypothetical protein
MFEPGDKYIHFTKYGGVNKGEIESCGETIKWDTENMAAYHVPYVKTTIGHIIQADGTDGRIYKIKGNITEETLRKLKSSSEIFNELLLRKQRNGQENNIS